MPLVMNEASATELSIASLGHRGDGIARVGDRLIYIADALPGEQVVANVRGERGELLEILRTSPERIAPICGYFGDCGGCATQHLGAPLYARWKLAILANALAHVHIDASLGAIVDAHGEGRRRATFHARFASEGAPPEVGFMQARAHRIVEIDACPVLAPSMTGALDVARAMAECLRRRGKPLDIHVTATLTGLDVDVRGSGPLDFSLRQKLIAAANRLDVARVANHGEIIVERRTPEIHIGAASVRPPPGGFLQATSEGERILAELALDAVPGAQRVADLFCGVGAFALRLAARHEVRAVEIDEAAVAALRDAAATARGLRPINCETRDLFRRPLGRDELTAFDAVVFDPPRAGAEAQARELAPSAVQTIVAVSCNAASFARDVSILVAGGYTLERVTPVDQFRFSPHVEIVGVLRKKPAAKHAKRLRARGILG